MSEIRNMKDANNIAQACCQYFGFTWEHLIRQNRRRPIAFARQATMFLLTQHTTIGLVRIAKMFNRDHATVIHARKLVRALIYNNHDVKVQMSYLEGVADRIIKGEKVEIIANPIRPSVARNKKVKLKKVIPSPVPFVRPPAVYSNRSSINNFTDAWCTNKHLNTLK
jgi:hypothetical protein